VRGALAAGAHDGRAVAVLARRAQTSKPAPAPLSGLEPRLQAYAQPLPNLADYDRLHGREARR
jgi:hypothetical protein